MNPNKLEVPIGQTPSNKSISRDSKVHFHRPGNSLLERSVKMESFRDPIEKQKNQNNKSSNKFNFKKSLNNSSEGLINQNITNDANTRFKIKDRPMT